jgi:hypothetical protein
MKPVLHSVDINVLVKVIRTLCLQTRSGQGCRVAQPYRNPSLKRLNSLRRSSPAGRLADWLQAHVEQRITAGRKDARTLNTLLGNWYIGLRKLCQGTPLQPLLQIIIDVAAEKSDCVLGLDSAKAMAELRLDTCGCRMPPKPSASVFPACMTRFRLANANTARAVRARVVRCMKLHALRLSVSSSNVPGGFPTSRPASWQVFHPPCWSA